MTSRFPSLRRLALPVLAAALLGACASSPQTSSTGEYIDDSVITAKVKSNLVAAKSVASADIHVETFKGRVLLAGYVNSDAERRYAEQLARSTGGVREVSNNLVVR